MVFGENRSQYITYNQKKYFWNVENQKISWNFVILYSFCFKSNGSTTYLISQIFQADGKKVSNWHSLKLMIEFKPRFERSIFQTFWRPDFGARFLFIELDTSNFGYLLISSFCWTLLSLRKIGQHLYYTFYKGPPLNFG